jgi:hypothetical protein
MFFKFVNYLNYFHTCSSFLKIGSATRVFLFLITPLKKIESLKIFKFVLKETGRPLRFA